MDLDALLAPISEAEPCGEELSFSAEFDAIQELRRADDPTLDQGEWVTTLKAADWPGVQAQCEQLLASRSKDLRLAAWLTEAKARLAGYAGLAGGLELCGGLCELYWAGLHPRIGDDGDADERAGAVRWLLAQVESLARQMPVLRHGARTFSLRDMEQAQASGRAGAGAEAPGEGREGTEPSLTPDIVAAARRATPQPFFALNLADAQRAQQALGRLQSAVDDKLGDDSPGFGAARRALEDAVHGVQLLAGDDLPNGAPADGTEADVPAAGGGAGGPLRSRAEALRQLRGVADFFRRTEPHSPVAYLAERAAQWGEMPLHTWLRSVVKDPGALSQVEELLGIPPPPGVPE